MENRQVFIQDWRQSRRVWRWHVQAVCSRHEQRRLEKLGHRRWTVEFGRRLHGSRSVKLLSISSLFLKLNCLTLLAINVNSQPSFCPYMPLWCLRYVALYKYVLRLIDWLNYWSICVAVVLLSSHSQQGTEASEGISISEGSDKGKDEAGPTGGKTSQEGRTQEESRWR